MIDPPPISRRLDDIRVVVGAGTALWVVGVVVLLAAHLAVGRPLGVDFATCVAGALLGTLGWGVFSWQRAAARRGSRTAQRGLD
ncbi:DUF2530 domain-containing protein [Pseudonocardia sp. T1-2H]|uniref:DUF2530 domain-containing protein n=1 Tax=Pseudonocardia sp. T1-2H TaxID=3128899 RepID=UPI003100CFF1